MCGVCVCVWEWCVCVCVCVCVVCAFGREGGTLYDIRINKIKDY